jgi:uncharacterized glyoxalase superfamily protein PhnB
MSSNVIPGMHYHDAPAAIEWLCNVLGFEKHAIYPGPGSNEIMHAELTLAGAGMIMIGSNRKDTPYGKLTVHPDDIGGAECRSVSLIVPDADAVYARAKAAGAPMVFDIEDKPYGGRGFTCRDPEGYMWHVGTYNPWTAAKP